MIESKKEREMRIAIASEKDQVTEHFGHCENFNIYDAKDGANPRPSARVLAQLLK